MDPTQQPDDLTGHIDVDGWFGGSGGHGDVRMGTWNRETQPTKIAVKLLRARGDGLQKPARFAKRLRREIKVWKQLKHENIVPLLGTVMCYSAHSEPGPSIPVMGMVSPWFENGSLLQVISDSGKHLTVLNRLQMLGDVAAGLSYLHSKGIIHGDLTGANVLIDDAGRACLVDFGLSFIKAEFEGTSYWSSMMGGAIRWRAPELLPPLAGDETDFKPNLTSACDIYSYGSVMLHVMSDKIPYYNIGHDLSVFVQILQGHRPQRPHSPLLSDAYWEFITWCWDLTPTSRPSAETVKMSLVDFIGE
ncbi:hypothetical protein HWV62_9155 [Athelia sp. TMB]|nr:hypothetical protein HWV62_9155 [Athelia sp. TMB]